MRIRKHFLSLSTPITAPIQQSPPEGSSGDHHNHEQTLLVVQHKEEVHPNDNKLSSLSDPSSKTKELESEKKKETIKIDVTGKKEISILCAETETSSSHDNGLFEGEKLIPTKKRSEISIGKRVNHDDFDQEYKEGIMTKSHAKKIKKNEKRGNVIKEGSRCSRVNGRGWRCGQQTIVGYSLCEHHLGKGRLRTMSTRVRGHTQKSAPKEQETMGMQSKEIETILIDDNELDEDDNDGVEEVELISSISKKKKPVGVVKERSLSSLLSQIDS